MYHHVIFLFVRMNTQHWALQPRSTLPPPSLASEWPRLERQPSEGPGGFFEGNNNCIGWFPRKPDRFLWLWWVTQMLYLKWQVERWGSKVHIWEGDGEEWGGGEQRSKFWKSRQQVWEEHKAWYFHKSCRWYIGDTWTHGDKSFCAGSNLWIKQSEGTCPKKWKWLRLERIKKLQFLSAKGKRMCNKPAAFVCVSNNLLAHRSSQLQS